jgi:ketosteroid isomerase-like protein
MHSYLKRLSLVLALITGIGGSVRALAADDSRDADHAALRALRDKVATAIGQQDLKALASCFTKEFAFTTVNQTVVTNEAQLQEFFDRMFRSKDAIVTSMKTEPKADILTHFIDANTGICYGTTKDTYTMKSGEVVEMNVRWSATVVKEQGAWKIALAHAGTDFLENPVTDGMKGLAKKVGLVAGLGGLLAGFLMGRFLCRRQQAA